MFSTIRATNECSEANKRDERMPNLEVTAPPGLPSVPPPGSPPPGGPPPGGPLPGGYAAGGYPPGGAPGGPRPSPWQARPSPFGPSLGKGAPTSLKLLPILLSRNVGFQGQ